jgi:hypothetical protein
MISISPSGQGSKNIDIEVLEAGSEQVYRGCFFFLKQRNKMIRIRFDKGTVDRSLEMDLVCIQDQAGGKARTNLDYLFGLKIADQTIEKNAIRIGILIVQEVIA